MRRKVEQDSSRPTDKNIKSKKQRNHEHVQDDETGVFNRVPQFSPLRDLSNLPHSFPTAPLNQSLRQEEIEKENDQSQSQQLRKKNTQSIPHFTSASPITPLQSLSVASTQTPRSTLTTRRSSRIGFDDKTEKLSQNTFPDLRRPICGPTLQTQSSRGKENITPNSSGNGFVETTTPVSSLTCTRSPLFPHHLDFDLVADEPESSLSSCKRNLKASRKTNGFNSGSKRKITTTKAVSTTKQSILDSFGKWWRDANSMLAEQFCLHPKPNASHQDVIHVPHTQSDVNKRYLQKQARKNRINVLKIKKAKKQKTIENMTDGQVGDDVASIAKPASPPEEEELHYDLQQDDEGFIAQPQVHYGDNESVYHNDLENTADEDNLTTRTGEHSKQKNGYYDDGDPIYESVHCTARMWFNERIGKKKSKNKLVFTSCCMQGKVKLPLLRQPPPLLMYLFISDDEICKHFRENIRAYNMIFSFTSIGGKIDHSVNQGHGPQIFQLHGENYHRIGSLLPTTEEKAKFLQLYIHDTMNEAANRLSALSKNGKNDNKLRPELVEALIMMLDSCNPFVGAFRSYRDRFKGEPPSDDCHLVLIANRNRDARTHNMDTTTEASL